VTILVIRVRPPPTPTLFPYTTLFRSRPAPRGTRRPYHRPGRRQDCERQDDLRVAGRAALIPDIRTDRTPPMNLGSTPSPILPARSEEHTSELQSLAYLVCRLLLEKKK